MDYPHPNPHFPKTPRKGAPPWGWVALVGFVLAVVSLLVALAMNKNDTALAGGIAGALGGMILAGIAFTRHAKTGGWRSGRIIPAVVRIDAGNPMQMALLGYWANGRAQETEVTPGRFWADFPQGSVVWLIQPTNIIPAQLASIAAPEEFKLVPVDQESEEWLLDRLQR